nr:hypothetical protein [Fournierella massiliensis]
MYWKAKYIILIGFSILVTYTGSLLIQRWRQKRPILARLTLAALGLSRRT